MKTKVSLSALTKPLSSEVWICLATIFIFSVIISLILFPKHGGLLELTSLLLGTSLPSDPITTSHKIFCVSWGIAGFILAQYYLASLATDLLIGDTSRIDNIEDLLRSDLKLVADLQLSWVYESHVNNSQYENAMGARISYQSRSNIEFMKKDILYGKIQDTAVMLAKNFSTDIWDLGDYAHQMQQIIATYPLSLGTWRGMPIMKGVNKKINSLIESGHVTHWSNVYSQAPSGVYKISIETTVGLNDLLPAILMLFFGQSLALVVLLLEMSSHRYFASTLYLRMKQ